MPLLDEKESIDLKTALAYARHCINLLKSFEKIEFVLKEVDVADGRIREAENRLKSIVDTINDRESELSKIKKDIEAMENIREDERIRTEAFLSEQRDRIEKAISIEQEAIAKRIEQESALFAEAKSRLEKEIEDKKVELVEIDREIAAKRSELEDLVSKILKSSYVLQQK